MSDSYDQFKTIMEENTNGHEVEIRYGESMTEGLPSIRLFVYRNYPNPGYLTVATYGLSHASHKDWSEAKPELMICVNTIDDPNWIGVIGMLADTGRKERLALEEGFSLLFNFPIGKSTAMKGLRVGGPAKLLVNPIILSDRRIVIKSVYPIYSGETDIIAADSWQGFAARVGEDRLSDVKRPDLSAGAEPNIHLSDDELWSIVTSVVADGIQELDKKGIVHRSDYYDGSVRCSPNFDQMVRKGLAITILLMNKVPKETLLRGLLPQLVGSGCPREVGLWVVDLFEQKLAPYGDVIDVTTNRRAEKFYEVDWFDQSVDEFISTYRKKKWWEVWKK